MRADRGGFRQGRQMLHDLGVISCLLMVFYEQLSCGTAVSIDLQRVFTGLDGPFQVSLFLVKTGQCEMSLQVLRITLQEVMVQRRHLAKPSLFKK